MKAALLAGFVALVFVGGIVVGAGLGGGASSASQPGGEPASGPAAPKVTLAPTGNSGGATPAAPGGGPAATAQGQGGALHTSAPTPGLAIDAGPPPPPPPPPSPEALAEAEKLRRNPGRADGRGNGQVIELETQQTPEERAEWEANRRAGWQARLTREREIKVRTLKERCQLTPAQEKQLVVILEVEGAERTRLTDALAAGTISNPGFDEGVRRNVEQARAELRQLLTPQQLEVYDALAPREQVLREETH